MTPLSEVRRVLREKLDMTNEQLRSSYDRKIGDAKALSPEAARLIQTLELFRDGLLRESAPGKSRRKRPAAAKRS
jgi:hypothetical protein